MCRVFADAFVDVFPALSFPHCCESLDSHDANDHAGGSLYPACCVQAMA